MRTIRRLGILLTYHPSTILQFAEAFFYLGWARYRLLHHSFAKVSMSLGIKSQETPKETLPADSSAIKQVTSAILIVSRYTFWESKCLVRAIAGMKMLERRGISSTLYLGTGKDETGALIAHAWLRSGPYYLTGDDVMDKFVVVEKFAKIVGNAS